LLAEKEKDLGVEGDAQSPNARGGLLHIGEVLLASGPRAPELIERLPEIFQRRTLQADAVVSRVFSPSTPAHDGGIEDEGVQLVVLRQKLDVASGNRVGSKNRRTVEVESGDLVEPIQVGPWAVANSTLDRSDR
jgi:hypothetical protein